MIHVSSISHDVAGRSLFKDLSIHLQAKRYGLVGPNGVGKTTLAKIILGSVLPAQGSITRQGQVRYFAQKESPTDSLLSDYLIDIWEAPNDLDILRQLIEPLNLERKLTELSGGEWIRARLAKVLSQAPDFLILDEPSNNLDRSSRQVLLDFVRSFKNGLLLISHDRELLENVDSILELSNKGLSSFGGNFTFYWQERTKERERQIHQLETSKRQERKAQKEGTEQILRQEKRMREGAKKAPNLGIPKIILGGMKRAAQKTAGNKQKEKDRGVNLAQKEVAEALDSLKSDPFLRLDFKSAQAPARKILVQAEDWNWRFPNAPHSLLTNSKSLTVSGSERWHLKGRNGSGKSTFLKSLVFAWGPEHGNADGKVRVGTKALAYLDQQYGLLDPDLTIIENLLGKTRFTETELRNELAFYGFTKDSVFQKVQTLSGGELLKASLAQTFLGLKIPELLILDEPTNNLDIPSLEILSRAIQNFCGALIVVCHDDQFVKNLNISNELTFE